MSFSVLCDNAGDFTGDRLLLTQQPLLKVHPAPLLTVLSFLGPAVLGERKLRKLKHDVDANLQ